MIELMNGLSIIYFKDLDVYSGGYDGLAKVRRLMFIAKHCPGLAEDALKSVSSVDIYRHVNCNYRLALNAIEQSHNTALFITIRQKLFQW